MPLRLAGDQLLTSGALGASSSNSLYPNVTTISPTTELQQRQLQARGGPVCTASLGFQSSSIAGREGMRPLQP